MQSRQVGWRKDLTSVAEDRARGNRKDGLAGLGFKRIKTTLGSKAFQNNSLLAVERPGGEDGDEWAGGQG